MTIKSLALLLLLSGPGWGWLGSVRGHNRALAQAQAAYQRGDAAGAAAGYQRALAAGTLAGNHSPDPRLLLNLAHAQAQAGQFAAARATYGQLLSLGQVPAALGSVAQQQLAVLAARLGQYAQALSLLRQALLLDPANAGARYDYEVLREFLARQASPGGPTIPPPAAPRLPTPPRTPNPPAAAGNQPAPQPQASTRAGAARPSQTTDAGPSGPPANQPLPHPAAAGQPAPPRPSAAPDPAAADALKLGAGPSRPLPTSATTGSERGLSANAAGAPALAGRNLHPGTEAATNADQQLQTQRERLRQLNLTPAQARQLLEALRAQEQQYLQQRPRPAGPRPRPGEPTW